MIKEDTLANVLYIDLSKRIFHIKRREDIFSKYIGGTGAAIKLLEEECPPGADPLGPENPIILTVGPLVGLYPLASKTIAMFKSPLTGNLGESHAGGRSALAIRLAGYGAIVIKGRSEIPVWLSIHQNKIRFKEASAVWGMSSSYTATRIIMQNEGGFGFRSIMRIGRAGEMMIPYACVATETYRHFGRLGLGAVFGSKNLKAVVVSGKRKIPVADEAGFRTIYDEIYQAATSSPAMKKYHDLGTPENVLPLNTLGALPTCNLKDSKFEKAESISGEHFASNYLGRRLACAHCPVGCIHIAALREPYEHEKYFYKTTMISYDHELIYSCGSMLGIGDPEGVLKILDRIEVHGLDAITTGVVLAWATEAMEKGLIGEVETLGLKFSWGDWRTYIAAIDKLVSGENEFYKTLQKGVEATATRYGGLDFAMAFGRNEMPGYHTGPACHLGWLLGARHSHLDNAGYSIDQKELIKKALSPEELVDKLLAEEEWRQVLTTLVICFFARNIYTTDLVQRALKTAGFELTKEDMLKLGQEIHRLKYRFKLREGFRFEDLRLPQRIYETSNPVGKIDPAFMQKAIEYAKKKISE